MTQKHLLTMGPESIAASVKIVLVYANRKDYNTAYINLYMKFNRVKKRCTCSIEQRIYYIGGIISKNYTEAIFFFTLFSTYWEEIVLKERGGTFLKIFNTKAFSVPAELISVISLKVNIFFGRLKKRLLSKMLSLSNANAGVVSNAVQFR